MTSTTLGRCVEALARAQPAARPSATAAVEATAVLSEAEGRAPGGWLGPWISESPVTPDLLQEAGYRYVLDWCGDDQPIWLKTRA